MTLSGHYRLAIEAIPNGDETMKGDDQILACPNWLSGLSRADGDMGFMAIRVVGDSMFLKIGEGASEIVGRKPVTRGDIRKLCSAFGIELREEVYRG